MKSVEKKKLDEIMIQIENQTDLINTIQYKNDERCKLTVEQFEDLIVQNFDNLSGLVVNHQVKPQVKPQALS